MHIHLVGLVTLVGFMFYVTITRDLRRNDNDHPPAAISASAAPGASPPAPPSPQPGR